MPSDYDLSQLYQEGYFDRDSSVSDVFAGYSDYIEFRYLRQWDNRKIAIDLFNLVPSSPPTASSTRPTLLDVGCAHGHFMDTAQDCGFDVEGVDRNPYAIETLQRKYLFPSTCSDLSEYRGGPFDAVAMLDVIEHFIDPFAALGKVASLVRKDGILVVSTPDLGSQTARVLGKRNVLVKKAASGEHLWFFTRQTLADALGRAGFRVIHIDSQGHTFDFKTAARRVESELPIIGCIARIVVKVLGIANVLAHFNHRHNMIAFAQRM